MVFIIKLLSESIRFALGAFIIAFEKVQDPEQISSVQFLKLFFSENESSGKRKADVTIRREIREDLLETWE